jgi:hypothetical protein
MTAEKVVREMIREDDDQKSDARVSLGGHRE